MLATYRDILNQAYLDRSGANPSYSIKSFARDLGILNSTLSEVLSGKKCISLKPALHFANTSRLFTGPFEARLEYLNLATNIEESLAIKCRQVKVDGK